MLLNSGLQQLNNADIMAFATVLFLWIGSDFFVLKQHSVNVARLTQTFGFPYMEYVLVWFWDVQL